MTGLIGLAAICVAAFIAMLVAFWYFAGFQYVILLCGTIFFVWLLQEFWPLIKYYLRGQR